MKLLVFAHRAEASAFTQQLECQHILNKPELWKTQSGDYLLITGEGRMESMLALSHTLSLYPEIHSIINFGIAGALDKKLKVNDIHPVKIAYAHNGAKPIFQSFPLNNSGLDCLSTDERILTQESKQKLAPFAQLLDRELWGLAMAARHHQKELTAIKIVSDTIEEENFCERIKAEAQDYSQKLYDYFLQNYSTDQDAASKVLSNEYSQLYLTKSMQHKLETLLHALMIKRHQSSIEQTLQDFCHKYSITEPLDKQQSLEFLRKLEIEMNPLRHELELAFTNRYREVLQTGASVSHDPKWEAKYLDLSIRITSEEQLEKFKHSLKSMSYQDFLTIMQGATLHANQ